MSARLLCLALAGLVVAWTTLAAAQTGPEGSASDDRYVPDLSQSYVQNLDEPAAVPPPEEQETARVDDEPRATALHNCQDYQLPVIAYGATRAAYGTACQKTDGSWQVVSAPSLTMERAPASRPSGLCREFQQQNIVIAGANEAYATACQDRGGTWQFVADFDTDRMDTRGDCRTYEQDIIDDGRAHVAFGRACEQPDGSWRIVSAPELDLGMRVATREPMPPRSRRSPDDSVAWEELTPAPYARETYVPAPPRRYISPPPSYGRSYRTPSRPPERAYAEERSGLAEALDRAAEVLVAPFRSSPPYRAERAPPRRYYAEPRSYRFYP